MYEIIQDFNHDIFAEEDGPFVSIYQNTHTTPNEVKQDQIAFKNHLKTVKKILHSKYDDDTQISQILDPLYELQHDKIFWNNNKVAVAILASPKSQVIFRLNMSINDKATVGNSLHKKPLIRHFQTHGMFDVLALNKERFTLYTCTKDICHEVQFEDDVPVTKEEVLGTLDKDEYLSYASYNGASNQAMYHGHKDNKDILEKDIERYFRYVDHFIYDTYSKPTKHRLVLWTLPEHQGEFRKLSKNEYLLDQGVNHSDIELTESQVLNKTWEIIKPLYDSELKDIINRYQEMHAKALASDDLDIITRKAIRGNVDTALISADKSIPGTINIEEESLKIGEGNDPTQDDILDDLAELIIHHGGSVYVLEEADMPTENGIAVIYRYK